MVPIGNAGRSVAILAAFLSAGCAYRMQRADSDPPSADPLLAYQTQVVTGDCIFGKPPDKMRLLLAPIADALLGSAIEQAVNSVGQALQEAAKATDDQAAAARNVEINANTFGACLQVARGWFHRGFADEQESDKVRTQSAATWAAAERKGVIDPDNLKRFWDRRMWLAEQPDFLFEAQVVPTSITGGSDSTLLTLAPVYARLDYPISRAILRLSKERDVGMYFAFHTPEQDPAAPGTANGGLILGRLRPGVAMRYPPPVLDTDQTPNRGNDESRWFSIALPKDMIDKKALTISALVTEHQDPSPFLQFWADVFGGAKPQITSTLQTALVPSLRQQAKETQATQAENALTAYEDALVKALDAATTCAASSNSGLGTAASVRGLLRAFNQAARAANRGTISEDTVPMSSDTMKVQSGCKDAQQRLAAKL